MYTYVETIYVPVRVSWGQSSGLLTAAPIPALGVEYNSDVPKVLDFLFWCSIGLVNSILIVCGCFFFFKMTNERLLRFFYISIRVRLWIIF